MGTDIHLIVEHQQEDGTWKRIPHYDRPCEDCDGSGTYSDGHECFGCKGAGHAVKRHYDDRDYDVFAMFADVRNGVGFAGVDTGDGFLPLSVGRGLPVDLSAEQKANIAQGYDESNFDWVNQTGEWAYDLGEHSETWLLWSEVIDPSPADYWERTTSKRGWVTDDQFLRWREQGHPDSWCGFVSGRKIRHVSNAEMERAIEDGDTKGAYTQVEWRETYREAAERFLKRIGEVVEHIGEDDPRKVRLVYGFGS